jgi:hypothetical protein
MSPEIDRPSPASGRKSPGHALVRNLLSRPDRNAAMAVHRHLHVLDLNVDCSCHALDLEPDEPDEPDGLDDDDDDDDVPRSVHFGEFLVGQRAIDRHQLLRALQMQDCHPGTRLGECLAALGVIGPAEIDDHLGSWVRFLAFRSV